MEEKVYREALDRCIRKAHENHNFISEEEFAGCFASAGMNSSEEQLTRQYLANISIKFGDYEGQSETEEVKLGGEDGKYLEFYLDELNDLKKYPAEEIAEITQHALDGDSEAKKELINIHLNDVVEIAKLYVYQGVPVEDLISEGNIGLMMAVDTLGVVENVTDVNEVSGYLGKMIMDSMDAAIAADTDERAEMDKVVEHIGMIGEKAKELSSDLRRAVTPEELAGETGIDIGDINEAMRLTGNNIEGMVKPENDK